MNHSKHLDSSIQILKRMRGDQSNELGSEQQRALGKEIDRMKKLKKQRTASRDEIYRIVSEVAETVSKIM